MPESQPQLTELTLAEASRLIHEGSVTSVELVQAYLERHREVGRIINCYGTLLDERALEHAEKLDAQLSLGIDLGALHGIPVAVKDNIDTAGVLSTSGSPIFVDRVPLKDATVVRRLYASGAIVLGKANLYEWAYGSPSALFGDVSNPWDTACTAGASSNGSAAAVSAGLAAGALGTDLGGSIRVPAAFCGIFGLKPTCGLVSRTGVIPPGQSLDHVGPMAHTARDAKLLLEGIIGPDPEDPITLGAHTLVPERTDKKHLRVALAVSQRGHEVSAEVENALRNACNAFRGIGLQIREVDLPDLEDARTAMWAISAVEACEFHLPFLRTELDSYSDRVRRLILSGAFVSGIDYVRCQRIRNDIARRLHDLFREFDFILGPAVRRPAWPAGLLETAGSNEDDMAAMTHFTPMYNLTGHPAAVFPAAISNGGLPVSLQIAAPHHHDLRLIDLVAAFEEETGLCNLRPGRSEPLS